MTKYYEALLNLQNKAYCKYSNFPVACIAIDEFNHEHYGVNVENSAYPMCLCAERNAIGSLITSGAKKITSIHILAGNKQNIDASNFASACGACRQVISEFMDEDGLIYVWNHLKQYKIYHIKQYLLDYFSDKDL